MPPGELIDYVSTLSPEIEEQARNQLQEDEDRRSGSVLAIREWLKKQPHLKAVPTGKNKINYICLIKLFKLIYFFFRFPMSFKVFTRL